MVAAVREGKLEASALAGAMGSVIPIASNMGVGFDEVGAAMAAMSRTGTDAASGATQLTAILASIKKPTDGAVQAMSKMGLSTEDVQKSLSEDGLLATLEMLQSGLKQTGQDTTAIFPNIRALKGVLDLTGAGIEDNRKIFDALSNTMGATDEAFKKTSQNGIVSNDARFELNEIVIVGGWSSYIDGGRAGGSKNRSILYKFIRKISGIKSDNAKNNCCICWKLLRL